MKSLGRNSSGVYSPQRLRRAGRCLVTESRTSQGGGHCSFPGISSPPRPLGLRSYVTFTEANPGALPTPHLLWFLTGLCLFPAASSLHLGLVLVTGLKAHAQGDSPGGHLRALPPTALRDPHGTFIKCPLCSRSELLSGRGPSEGHLDLSKTCTAS